MNIEVLEVHLHWSKWNGFGQWTSINAAHMLKRRHIQLTNKKESYHIKSLGAYWPAGVRLGSWGEIHPHWQLVRPPCALRIVVEIINFEKFLF